MRIHVIVVCHNAAVELPICLSHLERQSVPINSLLVVDCGSSERGYLQRLDNLTSRPGWGLLLTENIGYGPGNNLAYNSLGRPDGMVVFLNPDTFLPPDYLAQAVAVLKENPGAAVVSGMLLGFDPLENRATGRIDSTGIFRRWYGRWYDRGQGEVESGQYSLIEALPAVCGALLCCRGKVLQEMVEPVFDPDFFLYKEDIELSLRLRAAGWQLLYDPRLVAWHCRGWRKNRRQVPRRLKLLAATNEVLLYRKHPSGYLLWALLKLLAVRCLRL